MGMFSLDACIYTIIAVLGVAYPILLQVISRLDDKYSSARAVELFNDEPVKKGFVYSLIAAVAAAGIWYLKFPLLRWFSLSSQAAGFVTDASLVLVYLFTTTLAIFFFLLTDKTLTYYNTQKFSGYLQRRYQRNRTNEQPFEILADIFSAALSAKNSPVLRQIADFFSAEFARVRAQGSAQPIVYPPAYYQLSYRSTEELAQLGMRKNRALANQATGGGWLLGGHSHHVTSEETYQALWYNLRLALEYGQDDMVYDYWRTAHQYLEYGLQRIQREYEPGTANILNEEAIAFRKGERARFIEFHHALGALLLYIGNATLLRRLWSYTTSMPPRYPLLPDQMTDVFATFVGYQDFFRRSRPIDFFYPFPGEEGLASESLIAHWLSQYLVLLFLRQYTLGVYLYGDEPLAYPILPDGQPAKQQWLKALSYFRRLLTPMLQNTQLLQTLGLDSITEEQCMRRGVSPPLAYINNVEKLLTEAYEQGAAQREISQEKVQEFCTDSGRVLDRVIEEIMRLAAPAGIRNFETTQHLRGRERIDDKDKFSVDPEVAHLNFSTALALSIAEQIKYDVVRLFESHQTHTYRLQPQDLFAALDKLGVDERHVIINLGVHLGHLAQEGAAANFTAESYRGARIITSTAPRQSASLLVLRQEDLPAIEFLPLDSARQAKYGLALISERFPLYASVLDINALSSDVEQELREGKFGSFADGKVKTQALSIIHFELAVRWPEGVRLIQLISVDTHADGTLKDDVNTVSSF